MIALVLAEFLVLSGEVARRGRSGPLFELVALRLVAPLAATVDEITDLRSELGESWRRHRRLAEENRRLAARVEDLERELLRRESLQGDFERLADALSYARREGRRLSVADVVYADHASWLRSLVVHVGVDGAVVDQPVLAPEGLVGRVTSVAGRYAKVQLVTDRASAVGAMIARTRRQGVLRGRGSDTMSLEYVPLQADVRIGDRVVTAGIDAVFPRGITVGVVQSVEPSEQLFHRITVASTVDFGLLDHVYLLRPVEIPSELVEEEAVGRP